MSAISRFFDWARSDNETEESYESDLPEDLPVDLQAADRVTERTRQEFLSAMEDEELEGRAAYAAMESLGDWFHENSKTALLTGDSDAE